MAVEYLVAFAAVTLASMRITRVVRWDHIALPLRRHLAKKETPLGGWLAYLVHCHHCVSVYSGVLAAAMAALPVFLLPGNPVALIPVAGLAASELGILIHDRTEQS